MGHLRKSDFINEDIADNLELKSPGTTSFKSGVSIVSVTGGTKTVVISGWNLNDPDSPAEADNIVVITGNAAAGTYTINSILGDLSFTVKESIVDAAGGLAEFRYQSGSLRIGYDPTSGTVSLSGKTTVQAAILQLDALSAFGQNYIRQQEPTRATTTATGYQDRVTLTTPALTGTFRVMWFATIDGSAGKQINARLYNETDAVQLEEQILQPVLATERAPVGGIVSLSLTGSAKVLKLQWHTETKGTAGIADACIELWRAV